jgi:enoyl-CoA hydratase/carnithine racemase
MELRSLEVERDGPVLRVHLNRPERLNALDTATLEEIADLFGGLQRDFETRVVVLGGRGSSFCAGADRKDPPGGDRLGASSGAGEREQRFVSQLGRRAVRAIEAVEAVTIARLHGHVVGGGLALALACDFRVATRDALLHVPEVDLGEIGAARARELLLLCDRIDAERAERWGLVHRVVEARELDAAVDEWARRLAAKPQVAVHMTKTQLRALAARAALGDVTEADGDLLLGALRVGVARSSFSAGPGGSRKPSS